MRSLLLLIFSVLIVFEAKTQSITGIHPKATPNEDIPMKAVVSSTGNLRNDGNPKYSSRIDNIMVVMNPRKWRQMSFDICLNYYGPGTRQLFHVITDPVPGGGGKSIGVIGGSIANDINLSKPLTSTVSTLTDMVVGSSLQPISAEARFQNSTGMYSLIFGKQSNFYGKSLPGIGSTYPTITRVSPTEWLIEFPAKTIGRLWIRSNSKPADGGLFYYVGSIDLTLL